MLCDKGVMICACGLIGLWCMFHGFVGFCWIIILFGYLSGGGCGFRLGFG